MSWQAYVDSNLVGTGKLLKAAIHGHDGSLWATSAGFSVSFSCLPRKRRHLRRERLDFETHCSVLHEQINSNEAQNLAKAFKDASGIRAGGLHLGGLKYIALKADDRSVYGKKVRLDYLFFIRILQEESEDSFLYGNMLKKNTDIQGQGGVVCVKTKQAILIGVYDEPIQPGEATKVVEGLADYLISVNYVRSPWFKLQIDLCSSFDAVNSEKTKLRSLSFTWTQEVRHWLEKVDFEMEWESSKNILRGKLYEEIQKKQSNATRDFAPLFLASFSTEIPSV